MNLLLSLITSSKWLDHVRWFRDNWIEFPKSSENLSAEGVNIRANEPTPLIWIDKYVIVVASHDDRPVKWAIFRTTRGYGKVTPTTHSSAIVFFRSIVLVSFYNITTVSRKFGTTVSFLWTQRVQKAGRSKIQCQNINQESRPIGNKWDFFVLSSLKVIKPKQTQLSAIFVS